MAVIRRAAAVSEFPTHEYMMVGTAPSRGVFIGILATDREMGCFT
jgi:hypothetical protein